MRDAGRSRAFQKLLAFVLLLVAAWFILRLVGSILRLASAIIGWATSIGLWILVAYGLWYLLFGRRRRF